MVSRCRGAFLLATILSPALAAGQSQAVAPAEEVSLSVQNLYDLSLEELLEVKVSVASKQEEQVVEAPSSVSVFTSTWIRRMGVTSLQELLNYVPGFQSTRDVEQGMADRIAARGRSTALSESVLVLVDGQRINDLYTGGVSILNRDITVENIDRIEVIRGPGSALYGSNAFTGVVDIKTLTTANRVFTVVGDHGARGAAANVSHTFGDLRLSGFARAYTDDGFLYHDVIDSLGNSGTERDRTRGMDAAVAADYKELTIRARHMERNVRGFLTFGTLQDGGSYETTRQSSVNAGYQLTVSPDLSIHLAAGYSEDWWDSLFLALPANFELEPGFQLPGEFRGGPFLKSRHFDGTLDLCWQPIASNTLLAGFSVANSKQTAEGSRLTYHPITFEHQDSLTRFTEALGFTSKKARNVVGAYLQDRQTISDFLFLTVGGRLD